jgi:hypothetical protein
VTALYPLEDVARFKGIRTESSAPLHDLIERDYAAASQAEQHIRALAEREGVDFEWQAYEGEATDLIAMAARLQDLVVVGKTEAEAGWGVAERLAITMTGRPILIVPLTGPFLDVETCVLRLERQCPGC